MPRPVFMAEAPCTIGLAFAAKRCYGNAQTKIKSGPLRSERAASLTIAYLALICTCADPVFPAASRATALSVWY
jgi:hypothetical protein